MLKNVKILNFPDQVPEKDAAVCRSRLIHAVESLIKKTNIKNFNIVLTDQSSSNNDELKYRGQKKRDDYELSVEDRAKRYHTQNPKYTFDQLILPDSVLNQIEHSISLIKLEKKVFDEWGLRVIEPYPRTALNFHGSPGTGKTLAAHAIASKLNLPIIAASYSDIESMYHGEGPKNVEALFHSANKDNALLFIDEADSLLSKRLVNVTQGSEQAINSMRSQLLISLEKFNGIVIFATNLVKNYDKAFETRVRNIFFPLPDQECRKKIWEVHLPKSLPLSPYISPSALAEIDEICGRDIKNAIIEAALKVANLNRSMIELDDLTEAVTNIKNSRIKDESEIEILNPEEKTNIEEKIKTSLKQPQNT